MAANTFGAALQFTVGELGGPTVETESYPVAQLTATDLVIGNGDRCGLFAINLGANPVYISVLPTVSATSGILLSANGGLVSLNVRDDFTMPSRNWKMIATGGTSQMYVLELARFAYVEAGVT
jgi:hypothetical protein